MFNLFSNLFEIFRKPEASSIFMRPLHIIYRITFTLGKVIIIANFLGRSQDFFFFGVGYWISFWQRDIKIVIYAVYVQQLFIEGGIWVEDFINVVRCQPFFF